MLTSPPPSGVGTLLLTVNNEVRVVPVLSKGEVKKTFVWQADNRPSPTQSVAIVGDLTRWTPKPASASDTVGPYVHLRRCFAQEIIRTNGSLTGHGCSTHLMTTPFPMAWVDGILWFAFLLPEPPSLHAIAQDDKVLFRTDRAADLVVMVDNILVHHASHDSAITLPVTLQDFPAGRHHIRAWQPVREASPETF